MKDTQKDWQQKAEHLLYSDHPALTVTKFLLLFAAIGSIAVAGATVPGLLRVIKKFSRRSVAPRALPIFSQRKINDSLVYLKKKKLVQVIRQKNGKSEVRLTNTGRKRIAKYTLEMLEIKKPKEWDGKWRVLMFDIPSKPKHFNRAREALRGKIKALGFYQVQKSAWVYPYECEDEILFIAEALGIQRYVETLVVEKFLHNDLLIKKFAPLFHSKPHTDKNCNCKLCTHIGK